MYVTHNETGKKLKATITLLTDKEIAVINKSKRFDFNWNKEKAYEVYKITAQGADEPLGLLSIEKRPVDYAYEIRLLACSKENIGHDKKYQRIAGCLISFACVESFKAGYGGYVCLNQRRN